MIQNTWFSLSELKVVYLCIYNFNILKSLSHKYLSDFLAGKGPPFMPSDPTFNQFNPFAFSLLFIFFQRKFYNRPSFFCIFFLKTIFFDSNFFKVWVPPSTNQVLSHIQSCELVQTQILQYLKYYSQLNYFVKKKMMYHP